MQYVMRMGSVDRCSSPRSAFELVYNETSVIRCYVWVWVHLGSEPGDVVRFFEVVGPGPLHASAAAVGSKVVRAAHGCGPKGLSRRRYSVLPSANERDTLRRLSLVIAVDPQGAGATSVWVVMAGWV